MRIIKLTDRECSILHAIGFVESIPYCEQIELAEMPVTAFEVNVAYATT